MIFSKQKEQDNCCSIEIKVKQECPICHKKAKGVLSKTLKALLVESTKSQLKCFDAFNYCKTSSCRVVYFKNEIILLQKDIKVIVGLKDGARPATLCYCFEWSKKSIEKKLIENVKTNILDDIKDKMKNSGCSCDMLNPSGRCCLSDVQEAIKEIQKKLNLTLELI